MTEVFAIYDRNDKLVVCFSTRQDAENYGKVVLGNDNGWEYCIKKMYLFETEYRPPQPLSYSLPFTTPLKSPPYGPNAWYQTDITQIPKINV